jgi:hypothetical protein
MRQHSNDALPLSYVDERRARVLVAALGVGVNDRELLAKALATIDELRQQNEELLEQVEEALSRGRFVVRHPTNESDVCPTTATQLPVRDVQSFDGDEAIGPAAGPGDDPGQKTRDSSKRCPVEHSGTPRNLDASERSERQTRPLPLPTAPVRQLISGALSVAACGEYDGALHVWSDNDVAFELAGAERCEYRIADAVDCGDPMRAEVLQNLAKWHRRRARAIALLVQASDARRGWYHAETLLDPIPSRTVRFYGGPFDGREFVVIDPPRTMWIAHRPDGEALEGAYLIFEVWTPHDSLPPATPIAPPSGGAPLGWYSFGFLRDRFEWSEVQA